MWEKRAQRGQRTWFSSYEVIRDQHQGALFSQPSLISLFSQAWFYPWILRCCWMFVLHYLLISLRQAHLLPKALSRLLGYGVINPRTKSPLRVCKELDTTELNWTQGQCGPVEPTGWALAQSVSSLEHFWKETGLWVTQKIAVGIPHFIVIFWASSLVTLAWHFQSGDDLQSNDGTNNSHKHLGA